MAYVAGIVAILLGAVLVCFLSLKKDEEERLLAEYYSEDTSRLRGSAHSVACPCRGRRR